MALANFGDLRVYKAAGGVLPVGYPDDRIVLYSPVDNVHGALMAVLGGCTKSLYVCMYGFDDEEIANLIHDKLKDPAVTVLLTLDSSQAGGVHERAILAQESYPSSLIAIGKSEKGAIMHMKEIIVDGLDLITGSTNWSLGGETLQDNECSIHRSLALSTEATARQIAIHANMVKVGVK